MAYDAIAQAGTLSHPPKIKRRPNVGFVIQGGGHYAGPYAAGFLSKLAMYPDILGKEFNVRAVSATSSGALNAAAFFSTPDPIEGARRLKKIWEDLYGMSLHAGMAQTFCSDLEKLAYTANPYARAVAKYFNAEGADTPVTDALIKNSQSLLAPFIPQTILHLVEKHAPDLSSQRHITLHINACQETNYALLEMSFSRDIQPGHIAAACAIGGMPVNNRTYWDGAYLANTQTERLQADEEITDIVVIAAFPPSGDVVAIKPPDNRRVSSRLEKLIVTKEIHPTIAWYNQVYAGRVRFHVITPPEQPPENPLQNITALDYPRLWGMGVRDAENWIKNDLQNIGSRSTLPASYVRAPHLHAA